MWREIMNTKIMFGIFTVAAAALCIAGYLYMMKKNTIHEGFSMKTESNGAYVLPPLPYAYNALEPYIDAQTMEIHYTKHHQAYINKLNEALAKHPELQKVPLHELLQTLEKVPADIRTAVRNQGGGTINHAFFWHCMRPNARKEPSEKLMNALVENFGSFDAFKKKFTDAAVSVFGSGWAWLVVEKNNKLQVIALPNQDSPLSQGFVPLLGLDVWEHAYYLKYQNRRPEYIDGWWNVVNWDFVEQNYKAANGI